MVCSVLCPQRSRCYDSLHEFQGSVLNIWSCLCVIYSLVKLQFIHSGLLPHKHMWGMIYINILQLLSFLSVNLMFFLFLCIYY